MSASEGKYSNWRTTASYVSTAISIAMVIYVVGLLGLVLMKGKILGDSFKEKFAFEIYLKEGVEDIEVMQLKKKLDAEDFVKQTIWKDKEEALTTLSETEKKLEDTELNLQSEQLLSEQLQTDVAKKRSEIFVQEQNIIALSEQISSLLKELRIVANALETYEGQEITLLETEGLGERINKALATRIDQLKILNQELDNANFKLLESEKSLESTIAELNEKNENLMAINKSLGLEEVGIEEQLLAIKNTNEKLLSLNDELEKTNVELSLRDEELQSQISQYQELMNDLLEINDSLGLKDASLNEQLDAIRFKNEELARLNKDLIQKDSTIFNLRGKISELNNILSLSEDKQKQQLEKLELLQSQIVSLEQESQTQKETSLEEIKNMEIQASKTLEQVEILSNQIDTLQKEIALLNNALEASESQALIKDLEIEVLGEKLNKALTSKVFELQKYRSEFFGKLQSILGDRQDIKIVGDRFIFESELLFDSASADLQLSGKEKLSEIGLTLKETTNDIPSDIDWIIMVEGHTDKKPIQTIRYPSNWELSSARANTVLKLLLDLGFPPNRLASAGYGEFYPISNGETESDLQQNRRIELKLTSR